MAYSASRLTIFALLSGVEDDLRNIIRDNFDNLLSPLAFFGPDISDVVGARYAKEHGGTSNNVAIKDLCDFIDFADSFSLLNRHSAVLPIEMKVELRDLTPHLQSLAPIRNRVAHIRPLHFDDLANTLEAVDRLLESKVVKWTVIRETLKRLDEDPGFVLGLVMPASPDRLDRSHNLPLPDFDETGWVGRQRELADIIKLCKGPYPVVSILGEGGIGKTALVLKAAYELLDDPTPVFDAIVWSTSKTTQLTASEIVRIEDAITDSLGLFGTIAKELTGKSSATPLDDILYYLKEFRILVILDNLETVLDERIRGFVRNMPSGSKLLITSRVGLGAYEFPYSMQPMGAREAVQLVRAAMRARGLDSVLSKDPDILASYCEKMYNSPGYIKWFVSAVAAGQRPEDILASPALFLEFCMSNVYIQLDDLAKIIVSAMLAVPTNHSQAELAFITGCEILKLQKSLQQLLATSFVRMFTEQNDNLVTTKYGISDMAREYLLTHNKLAPEARQLYSKRKRQLIAEAEGWKGIDAARRFSYDEVHIRSKDDLVTARFLREAMKASRDEDHRRALDYVASARKLSPDYFEVARITAIIQRQQGNIAAARSSYEAAIELAPTQVPLRLWFATFLITHENDLGEAEDQLLAGLSVEDDCIELQIELVRVYLYRHDFERAQIIITKLITVDSLSPRNQVRIFDLDLQIEYRRADSSLIAKDFYAANNHLRRLVEKYKLIPPAAIDNLIKQRLTRALWLIERFDLSNARREEIDAIHEISAEIKDLHSGGTLDVLIAEAEPSGDNMLRGRLRMVTDRGFGFIKGPDGRDVFFSKDNVKFRREWDLLKPGNELEYFTRATDRGLAAFDVKLVSDIELSR